MIGRNINTMLFKEGNLGKPELKPGVSCVDRLSCNKLLNTTNISVSYSFHHNIAHKLLNQLETAGYIKKGKTRCMIMRPKTIGKRRIDFMKYRPLRE